jgi:pyrroline-5-carboxylate reductase
MERDIHLSIIGAGNIGRAIARGIVASGRFAPGDLMLTRRHLDRLDDLRAVGYHVSSANREAVRRTRVVLVAVEPRQLDGVLEEIGGELDPSRHVLVSVVSGATIADIRRQTCRACDDEEARSRCLEVPIVRAMPNTAIALGESMTCLATNPGRPDVEAVAVDLFDRLGKTLVIPEELMVPATALCACGIAFFLRSIRAASQGGIEIGFHPAEALLMAAQTALGAARLVREGQSHPESEIDAVTTPRGCTIAGLNEMEHQGFSSAMIKGIVTSAAKAALLYTRDTEPA